MPRRACPVGTDLEPALSLSNGSARVEWVALLRGINVGTKNRVSMADLRDLMETLGHADVHTHLNSGNVVFTGAARSHEELATEIEAAIMSTLSLDMPVIVRSGAEMRRIVDDNPFPEHAADHQTFHVTFLDETPDAKLVAALAHEERGDDDYRIIGSDIYLYYPNKITGAVFMPNGFDKALKVTTTSRNWRTVTKLAEMLNG